MGMSRWIAIVLAAVLAAPLPAQQTPGDVQKAELERIQTEKKAWIALNMDMTHAEADGFWPLYAGYQKELNQINTRLVRLIETYGTHYRDNTLTDAAARKLTDEVLAVDEAELTLRKTYLPRLAKVLPARKVARYYQLEGKVRSQMQYELAVNLPLAGDAKPGAPLPR